jgi:hypothetical protein
VQAGEDHPVRVHDPVSVRINGEASHLFDAAGLAIPRSGRDRQGK